MNSGAIIMKQKFWNIFIFSQINSAVSIGLRFPIISDKSSLHILRR